MLKAISFGYRKEGLALHKWALAHTDLMAIVLPDNRLSEPTSNEIFSWVLENDVNMLIHDRDSEDFVGWIRNYNPDIILCCCYTYRFTKDILRIPRLGCINIHPGKLPKYAGRRPIEAAMGNKEDTLWVSIHYMNEEFDAGYAISEAPVAKIDDLELMRGKLTELGLNLLDKELGRLQNVRKK